MRVFGSRWLAILLVFLLPLAVADGESEAPPPAEVSSEGASAGADAGPAEAEATADSEDVTVDAAVEAPPEVPTEASPDGSPEGAEVHEEIDVATVDIPPTPSDQDAPPPGSANEGQETPDEQPEPAPQQEEDVGEARPEEPGDHPWQNPPRPEDLLGMIPPLKPVHPLELTRLLPRDAPAPQPAARDDEAPPAPDLALQNEAVELAGPSLGPAPALLALGATAAVGALLVPGTRHALWGLLRALGIASLFTRVREHDVMEHPRRRDIVDYVRNHPGERLEIVRRDLGLSNGTMLHHLKILDHHNQVRVHREGAMARLYPAGPRIQPTTYLLPQRKQLLDQLRAQPGITQRELAATAGLSERAVSYHVGWLSAQGLLEIERAGTSKRCFAAGAGPAPQTA